MPRCGAKPNPDEEAYAHAKYKAQVLDANLDDTTRPILFGPKMPGQMMRVIRNRGASVGQSRCRNHGAADPAIAGFCA